MNIRPAKHTHREKEKQKTEIIQPFEMIVENNMKIYVCDAIVTTEVQ